MDWLKGKITLAVFLSILHFMPAEKRVYEFGLLSLVAVVFSPYICFFSSFRLSWMSKAEDEEWHLIIVNEIPGKLSAIISHSSFRMWTRIV